MITFFDGACLVFLIYLFLQVRGAVGNLICKLGANLQRSSAEALAGINSQGDSRVQDWTSLLLEGARSAAETIQTQGLNLDVSSADNASSDTSKKALKRIETVNAVGFGMNVVRSFFCELFLFLLCCL